MATQVITDPVILDSTGQSILSALEDIKDAVQPTNVYLDLPMSIQVSDWTQNGSIYSYTWTNSHITEECAIEVFFGSGSSSITSSVVGFEKVAGGVEFETSVRPSASLPVIVRVVNAKADLVVDNLDATMVGTEAINGVSSVEEALGNVNSRITSLNSNISAIPKIKTTTFSGTTNSAGNILYQNFSGTRIIGAEASDAIVLHFLASGDNHYFKVLNWSDMTPKAGESVSITVIYY